MQQRTIKIVPRYPAVGMKYGTRGHYFPCMRIRKILSIQVLKHA